MTASNKEGDFQTQAKNINRKSSLEKSFCNLILCSDFLRLPLRETNPLLRDSRAELERAGSCVLEGALPGQLRVPNPIQFLQKLALTLGFSFKTQNPLNYICVAKATRSDSACPLQDPTSTGGTSRQKVIKTLTQPHKVLLRASSQEAEDILAFFYAISGGPSN